MAKKERLCVDINFKINYIWLSSNLEAENIVLANTSQNGFLKEHTRGKHVLPS